MARTTPEKPAPPSSADFLVEIHTRGEVHGEPNRTEIWWFDKRDVALAKVTALWIWCPSGDMTELEAKQPGKTVYTTTFRFNATGFPLPKAPAPAAG
jgi:hypothetical protein